MFLVLIEIIIDKPKYILIEITVVNFSDKSNFTFLNVLYKIFDLIHL